MKHYIIIGLLCLVSTMAVAQEKIETDWPDQTESPSIVPNGWIQFEIGLQRELYKGQLPL